MTSFQRRFVQASAGKIARPLDQSHWVKKENILERWGMSGIVAVGYGRL